MNHASSIRASVDIDANSSSTESSDATRAEYENKIAHLELALASNRRIGIAIGIVMSRYCQSESQAFASLRAISQRSNRKLRDIADDVVYTGALPD